MPLPDIDDIDTYGGELVDYAPPEDPTTDRPAASMNAALASVGAMTQVSARAWARMVLSESSATLATTNPCDGVWPNTLGNRPTPAKTDTGVFTLTWPATIQDSLGDDHTLNLRWARVSVEGSSPGIAQCSVTSANVVTIYTFNTSFAANNLNGFTILVEVG